ncbi:MAG: anaerobic ribonucleoside-triphosphate reductase [Elusimicrobiota bacterium]
MQLQSYKDKKCHDCGKDIKIKDKEIKNGVLLTYEKDNEEIKAYKCNECYDKDKSLRNYQPTEVYDRIVGYLRPVQDWNKGKQQEHSERKTFTI